MVAWATIFFKPNHQEILTHSQVWNSESPTFQRRQQAGFSAEFPKAVTSFRRGTGGHLNPDFFATPTSFFHPILPTSLPRSCCLNSHPIHMPRKTSQHLGATWVLAPWVAQDFRAQSQEPSDFPGRFLSSCCSLCKCRFWAELAQAAIPAITL